MPARKSSVKKSPGSRRTSSLVLREPTQPYSARSAVWRAVDHADRDTPLLLDTHVWLWMLDATPGALGDTARRLIERAAAAQSLFVSDFSFWEVAMLVSKGRLDLHSDVVHWLERAATAPGVLLSPVDRRVLVHSSRLPGTPHGDPADRILLAQALALGASLMTCDRGIIAYASKTPGVSVCDARG